MNSAGAFFVRWRVRLGYPLALAVLIFARPEPRSILCGALVGIIGLALRAWAAGCLAKNQDLATGGPFAYTRNPLYVGTLLVARGFEVTPGFLERVRNLKPGTVKEPVRVTIRATSSKPS